MASPGDLLHGLQGLPKLALSYIFRGMDSINPVESKDERIRMLKRIEFYSVVEAGALGILSGLILLFVTIWVDSYRGMIFENTFWDGIAILGIIIAIGVVITMAELTVMYFLSLRNARMIASLNEQSTSAEDIDEQVMVALVNAGLQTPNNTGEFFGINPRKHISRWQVVFAAFFLKTKVSGSRAIIKMMWKRFAIRVFGRTVSRGALELASLPVFAFWNMWVMRSTIRELRMRSEMPLREEELVAYITMNSDDSSDLCLDTIEEHIFCLGDVHPNVERVFRRIYEDSNKQVWKTTSEQRFAQRNLDQYSQSQLYTAIRTLLVTMAIDPRSRRKQNKLLKELNEVVEEEIEIQPNDITHAILNGKELPKWNA